MFDNSHAPGSDGACGSKRRPPCPAPNQPEVLRHHAHANHFRVVLLLAGGVWAIAGAWAVADASAADEWPQFRGPDGQGHAAAKGLPTEWSESENIAWKTPIPGLGHSSPLVGRGLIWLTTATDEGRSLRVVAVEAATGRIVIEREVLHTDSPPPRNVKNSHASPTGVLEGDRLYVHFGTSGTALVATADGADLDEYRAEAGPHGRARQFADHLAKSADRPLRWTRRAIHRGPGQRDRQDRVADRSHGRQVGAEDENKAFATPLVIEVGGQPLVISPAAQRVFAYDPATGQERWVVHYPPGFSNVPRPIFGQGLLFVCTGYYKPELWAIRPDGAGEVTGSHVAWKANQNAPANPSPLLVGDEIYMMSDAGVLTCLDAKTGNQHWRKRVGDNHSASLLFADGKIYSWSEGGETIVIAPGTTYQELAQPLGRRFYGDAGGRWLGLVRSHADASLSGRNAAGRGEVGRRGCRCRPSRHGHADKVTDGAVGPGAIRCAGPIRRIS